MLKILSPENKRLLIEAAKKYGYKLSIYALVTGTAFFSENLSLFSLPPFLAVTVGLVLGEIHQWAQDRYDLQGKVAAMFALPARAIAPSKKKR